MINIPTIWSKLAIPDFATQHLWNTLKVWKFALYDTVSFEWNVLRFLDKLETLSVYAKSVKPIIAALQNRSLKTLAVFMDEETPYDRMVKNAVIKSLEQHNELHSNNRVVYYSNKELPTFNSG